VVKSGIIIHDNGYYYKYLFEPMPKPAKQYIENLMKAVDEKLKSLYELYRKGKTVAIEPFLYQPANWLSIAILILNNRIPESKKDIIKQLSALNEKEMMKCYDITRRIWEGEAIKISNKETENILALIENKLKECYMKLEDYNDKDSRRDKKYYKNS